MGNLLVYLKKYTKESILAPSLKLLEASLELTVPLIVAAIIDSGIPSGDTPYIVRMVLLLVGLAVSGLACTVAAQYFAAKASAGFSARLRTALFSHIQTFSYQTLDSVGTSTLITRITSDMNQVQTGLNLTLRLLLRSPFVIFGAMIMAFTIDINAAIVFAVVIPLLFAAVFAVMLSSIPLFGRVRSKLDKLLGLTRENLDGVRVIRAFGREGDEKARFEGESGVLLRVQKLAGKVSALLNPVTSVMINAAILVLIWQGALRVESGVLTQGQVVALYNYMSQILVEMIKLADLTINTSRSLSCARRISQVLAAPSGKHSGIPAPETADGAIVEFKNVSFRYKDASGDALSGIDFCAMPGESIGIIGGTGSGKTSVVNLIPAFYTASRGEVLFHGENVNNIDVGSLRGRLGIVPQKAVLFSGSVRDNLRMGADIDDETLCNALKTAQALDMLADRGGLDAPVEQGGRNFSGGQRQRLTVARAVARHPEVLILDDSSSALDFATDAAMRSALRDLDPPPTLIIVSQRVASVRNADRIIVLDDGEQVGCGSHSELLENCAHYRETVMAQNGGEGDE